MRLKTESVLLQANLTSAAHHCFGITLPRMQGVSEPLLTSMTLPPRDHEGRSNQL